MKISTTGALQWAKLALGRSRPEGDNQRRSVRILQAALTGLTGKGIAILVGLLSTPLTVNYLGAERYGLWMTMSSLIAMLVFADFGIGNGLLNAISEAYGKEDRAAAAGYVSSGFFMLSGIGVLILAVFILAYPHVRWAGLFNVRSATAVTEAGPAVAVFVVCFALNIPLGIVQRVQLAYQEGFASNLWQTLGSILSLLGILLVIYLRAGLPWLILAVSGVPLFVSLVNGIVLLRFQHPWLRPVWRNVSRQDSRRVVGVGILFFLLQLSSALAYSSDNAVASQVLGPEAVALYSVTAKLFSLGPILLMMVLTPLWPAYGEAVVRGDVAWAKRTLTRSVLFGLLVNTPLSLFLLFFGVQVIHLWIGSTITPPFSLLLGFGLWTILNSLSGPLAMFLNGINCMRFQVVCSLLMVVSNLLITVFLSERIGLPGIIWGSVIAQIVFILIPSSFYVPRLLSVMQVGRISEYAS